MKWTDKHYLEELGRNIAKKRKEGGMSQADLAYKIGMEVPNLSVIENGKSNPQVLTLLKIAASLNVHLKEILPLPTDPMFILKEPSVYMPRKHDRS
jgi:transcriptional regulator with XRE-family HTH domain